METITVESNTNGVCYLNMKGKSTYKEGLHSVGSTIELEPNTIYMMSAYETTWPYADKFLTILCDKNGLYHLYNYNILVGEDADAKERTNYVYQDTTPLIAPDVWHTIVKDFIKDKDNARLHTFDTTLDDKLLTFNEAWQLFRFLEIAPNEQLVNCDFNKSGYSKGPDWDWQKWNTGGFGEIKNRFSEKQGELIRRGLRTNIKKYNVQIDFDEVKLMVGRIDGRYAGIISINICYPNKYINFEKDMCRFEEGNEYVRLEPGETPNLFDVHEWFNVAPESFGDHFFNTEADEFVDFLFTGNCANQLQRVFIIGANENGCLYSSLLCE